MPLHDAAISSAVTIPLNSVEYDSMRDVWQIKNPRTLGETNDLCDGQRFTAQPAPGWCSATLIADDIMLSAGHCFEWELCQNFAVVFDFAYDSEPTDPMAITRDVPGANVYVCAEVLAKSYSVDYQNERGNDYSVFRLDRPVTGRRPAAVNWNAPLVNGQPAYVIGHPSGIPQKLAAGSVVDGSAPDFVVHDADVFGGNSGCGLFDPAGTLIGVHVHSSAQRYVLDSDGTCNVVAVCDVNATCPRKPHAYDPRKLRTQLSPELQNRLGIPQQPMPL